MKGKMVTLVIVLLCLCVAVWSGCVSDTPAMPSTTAPTVPTEDPVKTAYEKDPAAYVRFSQSVEPREVYVPIEEILAYETQYPECNGTWFRDTFTGEDLCIYNSYLYAMENRFIGFEMYVEDNDKDFDYIREALSMDSPLMEQNFNQYGEHISSRPTNYIGERIFVRVEQFTGIRWDRKMEALEICRQIVARIPAECVTQEQKMKYLYDYVCDHVEYVSYEKMRDEDYLYDAVCKGQTVCDGYSNMLTLLFNLIGVECCEVIGQEWENLEEATAEQLAQGHTWVAAVLDGQWYNFDPTFEDSKDEAIFPDYTYFAFSDTAAPSSYIRLEESRPKCTDTSRDFFYAELVVENLTDGSEIRKIARLAEEKLDGDKVMLLIVVRQKVTDEQYAAMCDKFGYYTGKFKSIEGSCRTMRDSTALVLTLEVR